MGFDAWSAGANAIVIGTGAIATGLVAVGAARQGSNGGVAFGDGAVASGANATALGLNASSTAPNSVAIGSGSTNTVANTVSVGSAGNERRVTNVAAGINPTDAVNVGQLSSVAPGLQSQIGGLSTRIDSVDRRMRNGVALAMGAGGVPANPEGAVFGVFGNVAAYDGTAQPASASLAC